jgi:hypothetical protein
LKSVFCFIIAFQLDNSGLVVQQHRSTAKFQVERSTLLGSTAWLRWTPSKNRRLPRQGQTRLDLVITVNTAYLSGKTIVVDVLKKNIIYSLKKHI